MQAVSHTRPVVAQDRRTDVKLMREAPGVSDVTDSHVAGAYTQQVAYER